MASKKSDFKTVAKFGIPVTLLFMIFLVESLNPFLGIEKKWWDLKFSGVGHFTNVFSGEEYVNYEALYGKYLYKESDGKISVAAIDEATTGKYGWPFKRRYYAELFDKLNKYKAKVIAMDVLLLDPDRDNPENDKALIRGISRHNNIINLVSVDRVGKTIQKPIKGLIRNSRYMAQPHADISMDKDGHIRYMFPFYPVMYDMQEDRDFTFLYSELAKDNPRCKTECEGITIPLLGAAAYALYKDIPLDKFYAEWKERALILNFRMPKERPMHMGRNPGKLAFNNSTYRHISVRDILEDKLSKEEKEAINGGVVFVGATATGAFDHFPTPYQATGPGVEFHANLLDNLIHDDYLRPISDFLKIFIMLVVIWMPLLMISKSTTFTTLCAVATGFFLMVMSLWAIHFKYDIAFAIFLIALFISYSYVMAYKSIVEGKEKKWIKNTFSQYLSPKVVNVLTDDPSKLTLGGEKRDMSVLFMDIAHFTTISEKMTPEELTKFLNVYLSALTDIILKYDGVVDKYIGDCIMAFWNAPLDLKEHRTMACLTAIECVNKIKEINKTSEFSAKPNMRFGINSGFATVGNMGSNVRFSYTAIGDTVNLASRMEGANKYFGSSIMISGDVYKEAKDKVEARALGSIKVVGKDVAVEVYEPLAKKGELDAETGKLMKAYESGIKHFYGKKYKKAAEAFSEVLKINEADGPGRFYHELSVKFDKQGDEGFEGFFSLTEK
ncbi:MAG: hypothetical protein COT17_07485 [Elusimicrobia bacterium CG08_land_8_20_14_0_20_51_18]|nr:MAG: hypothetical protein COT17_07485 [Elusimicrobia bacterium CG08_land_8_20_14_0_20_51_18]